MGALPTGATFVGDGKHRAPKKAAEIKRSRDLDFSPKQIVQHFCGLFNFCHALLCGGECPLIPIGPHPLLLRQALCWVKSLLLQGQGVADASQINPRTKRHCVTEWDSSVAL